MTATGLEPTNTWCVNNRFVKAIAIPDTSCYHEFIPISQNTVAMKYCSKDQEVATTFSLETSKNVTALYSLSCYYKNYWIGLVDLVIKFMHPHGSSLSFV